MRTKSKPAAFRRSGNSGLIQKTFRHSVLALLFVSVAAFVLKPVAVGAANRVFADGHHVHSPVHCSHFQVPVREFSSYKHLLDKLEKAWASADPSPLAALTLTGVRQSLRLALQTSPRLFQPPGLRILRV